MRHVCVFIFLLFRAMQQCRGSYAEYREKVWDHAAGAAVVTEAGGVITDGAGKKLNFAAGRFLDIKRGIVASSTPELHAKLLAAIASGAEEEEEEEENHNA